MIRKTINSLTIKTVRALSWIFAEHYYDAETKSHVALDLINYLIFLHNKGDFKSKNSNFVKVFFQSPNVEKVELSSIFRKHLDSIPQSFKSRDSLTVIFSKSKNIGSTIFDYKEIVDNIVAEDWNWCAIPS